MEKRVSVDRWLFTVTMLLVFVGLVMVFSASAVMARERFGSPYAFLAKQLIWAVAGLLAMIVGMGREYRPPQASPLVFLGIGFTPQCRFFALFFHHLPTPLPSLTRYP